MAECDVTQLMASARCFDCIRGDNQKFNIIAQLLCEIYNKPAGEVTVTGEVEISNDIGNPVPVSITGEPIEVMVIGTVAVAAVDLDIRDLVFATDKVDVTGSSVSVSNFPASVTANQGTAAIVGNAWPIKVTDGTDSAEVNARTDGILALEVADDMTSFETFRQALVASTDTTITFTQPVRLIKVKNESLVSTVFVRDAAIASDTPANAEMVGVAAAANLPNTDWFPIKTTTIHLRSAGTPTVDITGFF